jgi:hypothetical protein
MTTLAQLVWDCRAIGGMDKLVLMGWLEQVPDGSDMAYASKETVAECVGVSDDTVLRRTKELVKGGWLIATGGKKQWKNGQTPIYQVNIELLMGQCRNLRPTAECDPPQFAAQGSGSRFTGLSSSSFDSTTRAVGLSESLAPPPSAVISKSKEVGQTETVEPKPTPHGPRKSCPDCGEPLQRDVNHFLVCKVANGNSTLDEFLGGMPTSRPADLDSIEGGLIDFDEDDNGHYESSPFARRAEEARQRVEAERQKEIESILAEGRARATAAPFARSPRSAAPPQAQAGGAKRCAGCGGREPCRDKWCYAYEPLPKSADEIRPTGTNP